MLDNEVLDAQMNYQDPLFLSHSDNHAASLTPMLFDGSNFMIWSRNVKLALGAKNKKGFIEGKVPKPVVGHKDYNRWERNDYMVRCWIFRSMTNQVAGGLSLVQTSKPLWDELVERYSESNIPLLYQLKKDLGKLEQGEMSVGDYYCKLKKFWDEIYNIEAVPECRCGIVAKCTCSMYKKMLGMIETNRQTKKQKRVSSEMQELTESSAFHVHKEIKGFETGKKTEGVNQRRKIKKSKSDVTCDFCKKKGHDRSGCFEIYGYPKWYKGKRHAANVGKVEEEIDSPLDEEEYEA
uniref:Retrotransposon Copia-like N-terminal domain-containing protein n=1 Tax=Chenopodium quinoa TaxID=63459 RepID=A0A803LJ65_CHEQI